MDMITSLGIMFTSTATHHRALGLTIRQRVNCARAQDSLFF